MTILNRGNTVQAMKKLTAYIIMLYFRLSFIRQALWSMIIFLFFGLAAVIFFSSDEIQTKPVGWEKAFLVSSYQMTARNFNVASRGNFVVSVYEARGDRGAGIYASLSFNGGSSFLPPVQVAATDYQNDKKPFAALSKSGAIAVAWHDFVSKDAASRIFITLSSDMGTTWSPPALVPLGLEMEILPMVFYDDRDGLHLFYHGLKEGNFNLYHARRDKGAGFGSSAPLISLKQSMKGAFFPAIYFSEEKIFIVWQGRGSNFRDDLYFMKSTNYGSSWTMARQITRSQGNNAAPSIALYQDSIYVAYQNNDEKAWSIKLLRGKDQGNSWESNPLAVSGTPANCFNPSISSDDRKIFVVWYDERDKVAQVYSRKYNPGDGTFDAEAKLSDRNIASYNPSMLYAAKKIVVLWEERGRIMGKYSDEYVAPPAVYSPTHPEGVWSRNSSAVIEWKQADDESGVAGYVTVVNSLPEFNPPDIVNTKSNATRKVITELPDGVNYFHIRTIDGAGNVSRTVHYRLSISSIPPPMPMVFSPTHKEGVETQSTSPVLRWAVDDIDRLKGFYYSVAKGGVAPPETFTSNFELKLEDMAEGGYFFSISSVDKTNQMGPPATYYFVVGHAEAIDVEKIRMIAKTSLTKVPRGGRTAVPGIRTASDEPRVAIVLPFRKTEFFTGKSFEARIEVKNIPRAHIDGFAFYRGNSPGAVQEKVDIKSPVILVDNLADGTAYLGVRCRYFRMVGGKKKYFWTKPAYASFTVMLPREKNPVEYIIADLGKKISARPAFSSGLVFVMFFCTVFFGFGSRVSFYSRLMQFKFMNILRIMSG